MRFLAFIGIVVSLSVSAFSVMAQRMDVVSVSDKESEPISPSKYVHCLNGLPTTLSLPTGAPETMRLLISKNEKVIDYEPLIAGKGWGASIKYHSAYCDVVVYAYDKNKSTLTALDAQQERMEFDGFVPESIFEKEVGDYIFYGTAGITPLEKTSHKQVQMFSVAAVSNTFIKYRTVCRHITDIPADANYKIADEASSQVIKETLVLLDRCLMNAEKNEN